MLDETQQKKYIDLLLSYDSHKSWLQEFLQYKDSLLPKKIYRYRSIDKYNIEAFKQNYTWLSAPTSFNDVYDCVLNMNSRLLLLYNILNRHFYKENPFSKSEIEILLLLEEKIKQGLSVDDFIAYLQRLENQPLHEKLIGSQYFVSYQDTYNCLKQFNTKAEEQSKVIVKCKVGCFSETYNSILMWSHYTKYNKGFCLEYDISEHNDFTNKLYPILYLDEPPFCPKLLDDYVDGKADISVSQTLISTIKYKGWSYEHEWRVFGVSEKLKMPVTPSCLYLGVNIKEKEQEKLCRIAAKQGIPIKKMQPKEGAFELTTVDLT